MQINITEIHHYITDILKALDRNEPIDILYYGKVKGTILSKRNKQRMKVEDHPFFGMLKK